jgi:hypothetical protein
MNVVKAILEGSFRVKASVPGRGKRVRQVRERSLSREGFLLLPVRLVQ